MGAGTLRARRRRRPGRFSNVGKGALGLFQAGEVEGASGGH
jgi:hypothetical protein